jgi:hypothetical protein
LLGPELLPLKEHEEINKLATGEQKEIKETKNEEAAPGCTTSPSTESISSSQ